MEGTVISKADRFCIIRADDEGGEEFFIPRSRLDRVWRRVTEGAKVSFEPSSTDPPAGKKRQAIKVRLLGSQEPTKPDFVPRPHRDPERDLLVKVDIRFTEGVLQVIVCTNKVDTNIKLKAGGEPMYPQDGIQTDSDGKAEFAFPIPDGMSFCILEAIVGNKTFGRTWFRNPPQPEVEVAKQRAEKPTPTHLKVKPNQVDNVMILQVTSTKGPKADAPLTATKFTIRSESGASQFRICEAGSTNWQSGFAVELECLGQKAYQFQWTTRIAGENVYLRAQGNPQESGPYYVTGHCWAPQEPADAPQATTRIQ